MGLGLLDILYQVLTSPSAAFRLVSQKRPWAWAIPAVLLPSVVFDLVILPHPPDLAEVLFRLETGRLTNPAWWLLWITILPLALVIEAGLMHGVARLLRGRGSYRGMLCGLCFAFLPMAFFAPLALLRALLDSGTGYLLYYAGSAILFAWILLLDTTAIRENYRVSTKRAIAICFIAVFLLFFVPPLVVVAAMAF